MPGPEPRAQQPSEPPGVQRERRLFALQQENGYVNEPLLAGLQAPGRALSGLQSSGFPCLLIRSTRKPYVILRTQEIYGSPSTDLETEAQEGIRLVKK